MKKCILICVLILSTASILSCSNDDSDSRNTNYYGKWELNKMTGNGFILAIYTIGQPQWKETYDFKRNNTFVKTRINNGVTTIASGTFTTTKSQDQINFKLTYSESSDIIGSCLGNLTEELVLDNAHVLSSTWKYCDGPGFEYKKVK